MDLGPRVGSVYPTSYVHYYTSHLHWIYSLLHPPLDPSLIVWYLVQGTFWVRPATPPSPPREGGRVLAQSGASDPLGLGFDTHHLPTAPPLSFLYFFIIGHSLVIHSSALRHPSPFRPPCTRLGVMVRSHGVGSRRWIRVSLMMIRSFDFVN